MTANRRRARGTARMSSRSVTALLVLLIAASAPLAAQDWHTIARARQLRGEQALDVRVEYAAGTVEISGAPESILYRLEARYDKRHFELRTQHSEADGVARLVVDMEGTQRLNIKQLATESLGTGSLRLALSPVTPLSVSMDLGAAEAELDLGGLRLREIRLETGASDTHVSFSEPNPETAERCTFRAGAAAFRIEGLGNSGCRSMAFDGGVGDMDLDFSGAWGYEASATVDIGLGSLGIRVPYDVGVRLTRRTFLMPLSAPGFEKRDKDYVSDNWDSATDRLTLRINGALGTIRVIRQ